FVILRLRPEDRVDFIKEDRGRARFVSDFAEKICRRHIDSLYRTRDQKFGYLQRPRLAAPRLRGKKRHAGRRFPCRHSVRVGVPKRMGYPRLRYGIGDKPTQEIGNIIEKRRTGKGK